MEKKKDEASPTQEAQNEDALQVSDMLVSDSSY